MSRVDKLKEWKAKQTTVAPMKKTAVPKNNLKRSASSLSTVSTATSCSTLNKKEVIGKAVASQLDQSHLSIFPLAHS